MPNILKHMFTQIKIHRKKKDYRLRVVVTKTQPCVETTPKDLSHKSVVIGILSARYLGRNLIFFHYPARSSSWVLSS